MKRTEFTVIGKAVTKGSTKAFLVGGKPRTTASNGSKERPWAALVQDAAIQAGITPVDGPCRIAIVIYQARASNHFGTGRNADIIKPTAPIYPIGRNCGDKDKLERSILDALTGVAYLDDCQAYSGPTDRLYVTGRLEPPRAVIVIEQMMASENVYGSDDHLNPVTCS